MKKELSISEKSPEPKRRNVKSAARVLDILEFFSAHPRAATFAELASSLKMPKSSTHALLETLRARGYIYWLGKNYGYYPTRRWHEHASIFLKHDPIEQIAPEILKEISHQTGETAILAKQENNKVLYLAVVEPERTLRFSAYSGETKPLHSAASGRALLSFLPSKERLLQLQRLTLDSFSDRTITDIYLLDKLISEEVERGYHIAIGEYQAGTTAIAVGVQLETESYALIVGGPSDRMAAHINKIGEELIVSAESLKLAFTHV